MSETLIYKVLSKDLWSAAKAAGKFAGAGIDLADGYIHFSTKEQVVETVEKHFAGQSDLLLVAVDANQLGENLKWQPSRGGDLFPHLYKPLQLSAVQDVYELPLGEDGQHRFPDRF